MHLFMAMKINGQVPKNQSLRVCVRANDDITMCILIYLSFMDAFKTPFINKVHFFIMWNMYICSNTKRVYMHVNQIKKCYDTYTYNSQT